MRGILESCTLFLQFLHPTSKRRFQLFRAVLDYIRIPQLLAQPRQIEVLSQLAWRLVEHDSSPSVLVALHRRDQDLAVLLHWCWRIRIGKQSPWLELACLSLA